jgi:hypothetical protein
MLVDGRPILNPYQHQSEDRHAWLAVAPVCTSGVTWVLADGAERSVGRRVRSLTLHTTLFAISTVGCPGDARQIRRATLMRIPLPAPRGEAALRYTRRGQPVFPLCSPAFGSERYSLPVDPEALGHRHPLLERPSCVRASCSLEIRNESATAYTPTPRPGDRVGKRVTDTDNWFRSGSEQGATHD